MVELAIGIIPLYSKLMQTALFTPVPIRGEVVAGRPTRGEEMESGCIAVDLSTIGISPNGGTFALKVRGDSMIGAHILDGYTIVLEMKPPHDGAIVAALCRWGMHTKPVLRPPWHTIAQSLRCGLIWECLRHYRN